MLLELDREGRLALNGKPVALKDLAQALSPLLQEGTAVRPRRTGRCPTARWWPCWRRCAARGRRLRWASGLERRAFLLALLVHGLLLLGVVRYEPALPLPSYTVRLAPVPVEAVREEAKPQAPIPEARPAEARGPRRPHPNPPPRPG